MQSRTDHAVKDTSKTTSRAPAAMPPRRSTRTVVSIALPLGAALSLVGCHPMARQYMLERANQPRAFEHVARQNPEPAAAPVETAAASDSSGPQGDSAHTAPAGVPPAARETDAKVLAFIDRLGRIDGGEAGGAPAHQVRHDGKAVERRASHGQEAQRAVFRDSTEAGSEPAAGARGDESHAGITHGSDTPETRAPETSQKNDGLTIGAEGKPALHATAPNQADRPQANGQANESASANTATRNLRDSIPAMKPGPVAGDPPRIASVTLRPRTPPDGSATVHPANRPMRSSDAMEIANQPAATPDDSPDDSPHDAPGKPAALQAQAPDADSPVTATSDPVQAIPESGEDDHDRTLALATPGVLPTRSAPIRRDRFDWRRALERLADADQLSAEIDRRQASRKQSDLLRGFSELARAFRAVLDDDADGLADAYRAAEGLRDRLRPHADLAIPKVALCTRVQAFGVYDEMAAGDLRPDVANRSVVYFELRDFATEEAGRDRYRSMISVRFELFTAAGTAVSERGRVGARIAADGGVGVALGDQANAPWVRTYPRIEDRARSRRNDFFVAQRITLPAMPEGEYVLKVTVEDLLANKRSEANHPFRLGSAPSVASR